MKITNIRIGEISVPLVTPFKTALRTVNSVNDLIIKVETDEGVEGFGEAPPTAVITGDTKESITAAVCGYIAPTLKGMDVCDLESVMEAMHKCIAKNTTAKSAVDMALYDVFAKAKKQPLYKVLGASNPSQIKKEVETDITISVNPIDEMVRDSIKAVEEGFRILKIKVGKEGLKDVERIEAIRKAVGKDILIRVDANQGWTPEDSVKIIRAMEDRNLDIELVEQPVSCHDFKGMQFVTANVNTPVLADESVFSPEDAMRLIEEKGADLINIKLMKTGGIHEALRICDMAEKAGVECMIGCMLESKISVSAGAHLAAAKGIITKADLDGPSLCKIDPYTGGPIFEGRRIIMPEEYGLGITGVPVEFK